jgi:hypothetical protein
MLTPSLLVPPKYSISITPVVFNRAYTFPGGPSAEEAWADITSSFEKAAELTDEKRIKLNMKEVSSLSFSPLL